MPHRPLTVTYGPIIMRYDFSPLRADQEKTGGRSIRAFPGFDHSLSHPVLSYVHPFHPSFFSAGGASLSLLAGAGVWTFRGFLKRNLPRWKNGCLYGLSSPLFPVSARLAAREETSEDQKTLGLWLKDVTPKDAVIMSNSPIEAFYAEREFVHLPPDRSARKEKRGRTRRFWHMRSERVRYVLVNQYTPETNSNFLQAIAPSDFQEIFRDDRAAIYEVIY